MGQNLDEVLNKVSYFLIAARKGPSRSSDINIGT